MGAGRTVQHGCALLRAAALEAHRRRAAGAFGETFRECESSYRFGKGARGRTEDTVGSGVHDAGLSRIAHPLRRECPQQPAKTSIQRQPTYSLTRPTWRLTWSSP